MFCCGAPATSRLRGASGLLACGRTSARTGPRHPASMALVAPGGCVRTTRRILKPTRVVCGLIQSAALWLRELNAQAVRVPLWERARPRRIQRGTWHRLRRCSRLKPLPQGAPAAQGMRHTCGSGRAREESNAVHGTGYAGVRGHARSHGVLRQPKARCRARPAPGFRPQPCPRCARSPVHAPAAAHVRRSTLPPPGSAGTRTRSDPHPLLSAQRCARQSAAVCRSGWS